MNTETEPAFFETNAAPGVVGQPLSRVDGRAKVTGQAKYSAEYNHLPGLAHAVFKTSDVAKGRITGFDASAAQRVPGVLAILTHQNLPQPAVSPNTPEGKKTIGMGVQMGFLPLTSDQIHYAAQPVAMVVADTLEHAQHAAALLRVQVAPEAPTASYQDAKAQRFDPSKGKGAGEGRGNAAAAFASAPIQLSGTYTHALNHHNPMEPGATTAHWEAPDRLLVYDTAQGMAWMQKSLSKMLGLPADQVRVITKYLGGGFGCKGSTWPHTILTVLAAKAVGRPVKLALTRPQMFTGMGHREDQEQTLRLGATKDGKLLALLHEKTSTTSPWDDYAETNAKIIGMLYQCPAFEAKLQLARANVMTSTYMRAPGEAPGSFALESAMDDLAYRVGVDPIQIRLLNHADKDPSTGKPWSSKSLKQCYQRGAELFGWSQRNAQNGQTRDGKLLVGWGMATASYPVHSGQGNARVRLYADGHAVAQAAATDLGTGTYTVMTQVAADALGLTPDKVRFELGDTVLPTTIISGGSMAAGTVSSSVYLAAQDAWQKLIKVAVMDAKSPLFRAKPADVEVVQGRLQLKATPGKGEDFAALMKRAGLDDVEGMATGRYGAGYESAQAALNAKSDDAGKDDAGQHSMHSFGAHFCEVKVDPELGTVRVTKWVSVIAGGRILNPKTARSQIMGGAIMGIGAALMEQTVRDQNLARYTNASLADYHIPVNADVPDMTVEFIDEHDPYINAMGVKGIGEVSIVGTAAAVGNAIFHATGRRLRSLPITPDKVLDALRQPA
ncbi:xanthine dehydrogenase family protein molybdopterin-binding subunit [Hymenobacter jeollabukensis]|uniref:Xanthine dehydrogenase family protein molybdopterin-binding subunit n=1 Tax=Hymenobacter jeollabukensis TaxID=2025313 RepID=A0A5R8WP70_9BACT|nr:xanthine dehydrogenase family protein molybdopterin-binding subunit [Hymenobacter jeollabukensis]TLM91211.1 xanthine dehydrogenase family protein molybdopterin-binding subunit [Hymenobacter jeollabukensis]